MSGSMAREQTSGGRTEAAAGLAAETFRPRAERNDARGRARVVGELRRVSRGRE